MEFQGIEKILKSSDIAKKKIAIDELQDIVSPASLNLLYKASYDTELAIRYKAKGSLRVLREKIINEFFDFTEEDQIEIIKYFGDYNDRESISFMCDNIFNVTFKVQIYLTQSLGLIGDKNALSYLIELYHKPDLHDWVKSSLVKAIGRLGGKNEIPLLQKMLESNDNRLRANTIEALEFIGTKDIIPLILPLLNDADGRVKAFAAKALWKFGDEKMLSRFQNMLEHSDMKVKDNIIYALGETGDIRLFELIKSQLVFQDESLLKTTVQALSKIIFHNPSLEFFMALSDSFGSKSTIVSKLCKNSLINLGEKFIRFDERPEKKAVIFENIAKAFYKISPSHAVIFQKLCIATNNTPENHITLSEYYIKAENISDLISHLYNLLLDNASDQKNIVIKIIKKLLSIPEKLLPEINRFDILLNSLDDNTFTKDIWHELIKTSHSFIESRGKLSLIFLSIILNKKSPKIVKPLVHGLYSTLRSISDLIDKDTLKLFEKSFLSNKIYTFENLKKSSLYFIMLKIISFNMEKDFSEYEKYLKQIAFYYTVYASEIDNDIIKISSEFLSKNLDQGITDKEMDFDLVIADFLAQQFARFKEYRNSAKIYERLLEKDPENVEIHLKIASIYEIGR